MSLFLIHYVNNHNKSSPESILIQSSGIKNMQPFHDLTENISSLKMTLLKHFIWFPNKELT